MYKFLTSIYNNNVLANLLFILVLLAGTFTYHNMPREQDPSINFNWIQAVTVFPGASAADVETLVTNVLEDAIQNIADVKFVSSVSREAVSNILIRFEDIDERTFDKRLSSLRREIQNKATELPPEVDESKIFEITSANSYPTATIIITGNANDEILRSQARTVKRNIEQLSGVDKVSASGLQDPELQINFLPEKLLDYGINANDLEQSIRAHFRDIPAGSRKIGNDKWLIRWLGKATHPEQLANLPIINNQDRELLLHQISQIQRARETASKIVSINGTPAIMLAITKQESINTIELVNKIEAYITAYNANKPRGTAITLLDDQTETTKNAINVMQTNAFYGLILVLITTWIFLGIRIAALVAIGIPFTLAATFIFLKVNGHTLNVSVLLGIVIALGMLVDDSVVIVEAIYFRLARGASKMTAILEALKEVSAPVITSVLTTAAAFTPLMLMPGILGKFMFVIPLTVTTALLLSLIEAFWMLPAHINELNINLHSTSRVQQLRIKLTHILRIKYTKFLIKILRNPKKALLVLLALIILAATILKFDFIRVDFFANDPKRLFYVNVEMPSSSSLETTLRNTEIIEQKIRDALHSDELHACASYAGMMFTRMEPYTGDRYGQVLVSLKPQINGMRNIYDIVNSLRDAIYNTPGPNNISFLVLTSGPPVDKPVKVKIRGSDYKDLRAAVQQITQILQNIPGVHDIANDDYIGSNELILRPNLDAINRANINPQQLANTIRLLVDGKIITDFQENGEKIDVRLKSIKKHLRSTKEFLQQNIIIDAQGTSIRLQELVHASHAPSAGNIRHYNFKRTITVSADINKDLINTVAANKIIKQLWHEQRNHNNDLELEFSGALDDIQESLDTMPMLFLLGLGAIYLILGTQFKSYLQPLIVLATIPLAFLGVIFGLFISNNPLSLYTLYGIVALSGITVNTAIALISAANQRLEDGMSVTYAIVFAARRRLIPILITSATTIAGLFSLAIGLGGKSLMWGPVAIAIVWGLLVATSMALVFIPLLYRLSVKSTTRNA
ncbi:MAG: cation transporter [Legionellales bacterium]|nr:MAG: cation transporter [Legionellales bacterium]